MAQPSADAVMDAVVGNPDVQAAAVHVVEAANTEINAMHALSAAGPAQAPAHAPAQVRTRKPIAMSGLYLWKAAVAQHPCSVRHSRYCSISLRSHLE